MLHAQESWAYKNLISVALLPKALELDGNQSHLVGLGFQNGLAGLFQRFVAKYSLDI